MMNNLNRIQLACAIGAMFVLTGCSSLFNPIGESTFDCNRKENPSEYCRSFKAVEKSTSDALPESRFDKEFKMSDYDQATGVAPVVKVVGKDDAKTDAPVQSMKSQLPHNRPVGKSEIVPGAPVRQAPVIQRVYIKSFVDENDMLQGDLIVYKEVQGSKWTGFDAPNSSINVAGGAVYPHKPKNSLTSLPEPSGQMRQSTNNFAQPDSKSVGKGETVLQPAESGSDSMPN